MMSKKILALCLCALITVSGISFSSAVTPNGRQIAAADFLRSEGGYLKNTSNEIVVLRGVNAGGWLIQESWMCPINGADRAWANLDTLNTLKNRGFTETQIQTLLDTYQNNWFTTVDLDNLKAMGINCVRVPFWYRNFMKDEAGTWITGTDLNNNPGIKKLDWVISECGKRGMYVILDCHGAPGGQSMDHCCGTLAKNELYDSAANRAIFKDLWTKIATRYKGNPVVAAYDIMNEPQNNSGYSGANAWAPGSTEALSRTYSVYDEMYKAIRAVDPDHVISMEAIWTGTCLPDPRTYGWTNLLYQMHIYDTSTGMIDTRVNELKNFQSQYGVAVYTGEFNCDPNEEYAMDKFNQAGISWTTWAYKGSKQSVGNNWFLYVKNLPYADSTVDSYNTILSKWGTVLNTNNFDTNTGTVKTWITNNVNDPIPVPPGPKPIPGKIEAEGYNSMSGIQTETCSDTGGGQNVGYIETGDWMDYSVNVASAGTYTVNFRVASQSGSSNGLQLKNGSTVLCTVSPPNTGGWQTWTTVSANVTLAAGAQTLRVYANNSGFNINWIEFVIGGTPTPTPTPTPPPSGAAIPGKIEAESYNSMSGIQTETCSDTDGGQNVGYIETGDWMDYSVNVASAGTYTVNFRVASQSGSSNGLQLKSGSTVLCTVSPPNTGGWQTWTTVSANVTLAAGAQTLRVYANNSGFNLNWIEFVSGAQTPVELPRTGWTASASNNSTASANAIDSNASTRWDSGTGMSNGMWFQVDMKSSYNITRVVVDTTASSGDYMRSYQLYASTDGTNWGTAVATGSGSTVTTINFTAKSARYIKIVQTGSAGSWWSIHDLKVYRAP